MVREATLTAWEMSATVAGTMTPGFSGSSSCAVRPNLICAGVGLRYIDVDPGLMLVGHAEQLICPCRPRRR